MSNQRFFIFSSKEIKNGARRPEKAGVRLILL